MNHLVNGSSSRSSLPFPAPHPHPRPSPFASTPVGPRTHRPHRPGLRLPVLPRRPPEDRRRLQRLAAAQRRRRRGRRRALQDRQFAAARSRRRGVPGRTGSRGAPALEEARRGGAEPGRPLLCLRRLQEHLRVPTGLAGAGPSLLQSSERAQLQRPAGAGNLGHQRAHYGGLLRVGALLAGIESALRALRIGRQLEPIERHARRHRVQGANPGTLRARRRVGWQRRKWRGDGDGDEAERVEGGGGECGGGRLQFGAAGACGGGGGDGAAEEDEDGGDGEEGVRGRGVAGVDGGPCQGADRCRGSDGALPGERCRAILVTLNSTLPIFIIAFFSIYFISSVPLHLEKI